MSEPTGWAIDAARRAVNCLWVDTFACGIIIQEAIDQACASRDTQILALKGEIERLKRELVLSEKAYAKAHNATPEKIRAKAIADAFENVALKQEIKRLKAQLDAAARKDTTNEE